MWRIVYALTLWWNLRPCFYCKRHQRNVIPSRSYVLVKKIGKGKFEIYWSLIGFIISHMNTLQHMLHQSNLTWFYSVINRHSEDHAWNMILVSTEFPHAFQPFGNFVGTILSCEIIHHPHTHTWTKIMYVIEKNRRVKIGFCKWSGRISV
jgi:hypothetical protein